MLALSALIVVWETAVAVRWLDPFFVSSPSRLAVMGAREIQLPSFWNDLWVSSAEFAIGYAAAVVLGTAFGLLIGWYRGLGFLFEPWLNAFNSLPRIALLPLIVLWVGLGIWSKVVVVFLGVFFPVALNAFSGVRTVDRRLIEVAASFSASQGRVLRTVVLPATLPFVFAGARLGVGRGVAGVVVGEFYSADAGIAHRIFRAGQTFQTDRVLFGAVVITVLALFAFKAISLLEKRYTRGRRAALPFAGA